MSNTKFISIDEVLEKTTFGRSSLYAKVSKGLFPKPVKVGSRKIAWPQYEIDQMMNFYISTTNEERKNLYQIRKIRERSVLWVIIGTQLCSWSYKDFNQTGTYKQRYVDYNPLSRECKSRHRRFLEFINASGLIEELRALHLSIREFYRKFFVEKIIYKLLVNKVGGIPVLLTEPYGANTPNKWAGNFWSSRKCYIVVVLWKRREVSLANKSFLCVNIVRKHLEEIALP